jgi:uncharacterized membrane protein (DUF485 family)
MLLPLLVLSDDDVSYLVRRRVPEAVLALWVLSVVRFFAGDVFGGLNDALTAFCGTAVLKASPSLNRVVRLLEGCCANLLAQGAMQWFFPFLLLSTLNAFFDAVQVVSLSVQIGLPIAVNVLFWVWVCSVVVKAYAAHAAWQVCQQLATGLDGAPGDYGYNPLPEGPPAATARGNLGAAVPPAQQPTSFVPFSGEGRMIG